MRYIVLTCRLYGGGGQPIEEGWNWDQERFDTSKAAIAHGLESCGSDDFNIGVLRNGVLTEVRWMDEPHPDEDLRAIGEQTGLRARRQVPQ